MIRARTDDPGLPDRPSETAGPPEAETPRFETPPTDSTDDDPEAGSDGESSLLDEITPEDGETASSPVGDDESVELDSTESSAPTPEGRGAAEDEESGDEDLEILEGAELQGAIEAVLFSTGTPLTVRQLAEAFEVSVHDVREAVENLREDFEDSQRSFRLVEVGGGLQFLTLPRYFTWVSRFHKKSRAQRLSRAALETLAVIAYKQPLSRATLEGIRGVQCGPILKTLLDRGLVKIVGKEESLGNPLLYGTTQSFLESFGLPSLEELPQPEADAARDED